MAKQALRIEIPANPEEQLKSAQKIYGKHTTDGANSPLKVMQDFKWDTVGSNSPLALQKHYEAVELQKKMEKAYEERNNLMADIRKGLFLRAHKFLNLFIEQTKIAFPAHRVF